MNVPWSTGDVDAARNHFAWLCRHPEFRLSKRQKRLLSYLLDRSPLGANKGSSQAEIARDVLGRDGNFDPSVDAHVRVEMARLRTALELFYSRLDAAPTLRFDLPKGFYRIVIERTAAPTPMNRRLPENDCIIALAEPVTFAENGRELAHLIVSETLHRCSQSPVVRCGALSVTLLPPHESTADALDAAKAAGAAAVAICHLFANDRDSKAFITLFDTVSRSLVTTRSLGLGVRENGCLAFIRNVGVDLAAILSDPFEGIGPTVVARRSQNARLGAILSAYSFISSQELPRALMAAIALQDVIAVTDGSCPTSIALYADMIRVCHNAGIWPEASRQQALVLAARAYDTDRGNATTMLSLGYAALSVGSTELAGSAVAEPLAGGVGATWRTDHALLSALTIDPGDSITIERIKDLDGATLLSDMLAVVPAIRRGDETAALEALGVQRHGETMWHDLLRGIAAAHAGDRHLAKRSISRVTAAVPEINSRVGSMLSGFFPDPGELEYLIGGLRKAGMPVVASVG